jgi:hypothetical protein
MDQLRRIWARSTVYRLALITAITYTLLRIGVQFAFLILLPQYTPQDGTEQYAVPVDLKIYLDAARHLQMREDLYPQGPDRIEVYQYTPVYALAFAPFLALPPLVVAIVHTLAHFGVYGLLYARWWHIFGQFLRQEARESLVWTLPVWLLFSSFWTDLGYLNIYVIVALLATLLIEAILNEQLGWSLLWLSIILQIKPHWSFAVAVPLLLRRYRFFARLVGLALVTYVAVAGLTVLALGPSYGCKQYIDYVQLLANMRAYFPWRGPDAGYLGYNHSVTQIVVYVMGTTPAAFRLATIVKGVFLIPLAAVCARALLRPARQVSRERPQTSLDLAFALYLGAFIWLDMVWELSLGVALYAYLLATVRRQGIKVLVSIVFLLYALLDPLRVVSYGLSMTGLHIVDPGPYILTDPNIYIPTIMIAILIFYGVLLKRLATVPTSRTSEAPASM